MSEQTAGAVAQRFHATNGRIPGYLGLAAGVLVLVLAISDRSAGRPLGVAILAALGLLLVWVVMLRPALWVTDRDLVLRGMLHTDAVPLSRIDKVAVSQVTAVTADGKRYVSPVVGYSARQTVKQRRSRQAPVATAADTYQVFVEERIAHLAREARDRAVDDASTVRRTLAWPEITGIVVLGVAFLAWLLVL